MATTTPTRRILLAVALGGALTGGPTGVLPGLSLLPAASAQTLSFAQRRMLPPPVDAPAPALPPSAPTSIAASAPTSPAPAPSAATAAPPARAAAEPAQRARVVWAGGQLSISAENSSLNQILREIARQTGMKITGGVVEERVYGSYGPADSGSVLNALLEGTGSNLLLQQTAADAPQELVLTPRHGGPTPPNPSAMAQDENTDDLPPRPGAGLPPQGQYPAPPTQIQQAQELMQNLNPPAQPAQDSGSNSSADQPNGGVKTPQQIYDQLMKLQQQRPASPQ